MSFYSLTFTLVLSLGVSASEIPESPCPEYFSYINDTYDGVYGLMTLPNDGSKNFDIEIYMAALHNPCQEVSRQNW